MVGWTRTNRPDGQPILIGVQFETSTFRAKTYIVLCAVTCVNQRKGWIDAPHALNHQFFKSLISFHVHVILVDSVWHLRLMCGNRYKITREFNCCHKSPRPSPPRPLPSRAQRNTKQNKMRKKKRENALRARNRLDNHTRLGGCLVC